MRHLHAELTPSERDLLSWLLPAERPFYRDIREAIDPLPLHRSRDGSLTFGEYDEALSDTVTIGEVEAQGVAAAIALRMNDERTAAFLQMPGGEDMKPVWCLSHWSPGTASSELDTIRQIPLLDASGAEPYTLALSPAERVLWLHHADNGYNQLLPVTGLLVELARVVKPASMDRLTSEQFFTLARAVSDEEIRQALLRYNERAKRFDASKVVTKAKQRSRNFFDLFSKRR